MMQIMKTDFFVTVFPNLRSKEFSLVMPGKSLHKKTVTMQGGGILTNKSKLNFSFFVAKLTGTV